MPTCSCGLAVRLNETRNSHDIRPNSAHHGAGQRAVRSRTRAPHLCTKLVARTRSRTARRTTAGRAERKQQMSLRTAWGQMIARCYDPKHHKYESYGGRGIRVCDRWICFWLFEKDMGERPPGMTLNRINNDGPYSPENCEWASHVEQNRNRRDNLLLTHNGETRCLAQWAERLGVRRQAIRRRIDCGWSVEEALTIPFKGKHANSNV